MGNKLLLYILPLCISDGYGFGRETDLSRRTCFIALSVAGIDAIANSIDLDLENKAEIPLFQANFFLQG